MVIIESRSSSTYYINKFYSTKDPYDTRSNKYVDIKYGTISLSFNENKILVYLSIHIAGDFNLPAGCIQAEMILPSQTISEISLYKQDTVIASDFPYGYSDSSKIYGTQFTIDVNDDDYLSENLNNSFQINLNFNLNTSQLDNLEIDDENVNNFINNLKNTNLIFYLNLYQQTVYTDISSNGLIKINQITKIDLTSQVESIDNSKIIANASQVNTTKTINLIANDYTDQYSSFNYLLTLQSIDDSYLKITFNGIKIAYYIDNKLYETNSITLNSNITSSTNIYDLYLTNYQTTYNSKTEAYELESGSNGIYFDQTLNGYYVLSVSITIDGSSKTYTFQNLFNFIKSDKVKMNVLTSNELDLKITDSNYEEISE